MNCQLCVQRFDLSERVPLLLSDCGHTFCSQCIKGLSQEGGTVTCPVDGIFYERFSDFKTNKFIYLQLENAFSQCQNCLLHQLPKKRRCLTCQINVCDECTITKVHEKHLFESLHGAPEQSSQKPNRNQVTLLLAELKQMKLSVENKQSE